MTDQQDKHPKEPIRKSIGARRNIPKVDYTHLPPEIMAVVNEGRRTAHSSSGSPCVTERQKPSAHYVRSDVLAFAEAMETTLRKNDYKGGWYEMSVGEILERIDGEHKEAHEAWDAVKTQKDYYKVSDELIDVANFCMMFWERMHVDIIPTHFMEHDAAIAAQAAATEREQILKKLTALKNKLGSAEMSDCSLAVSKKYGAGRIALEGAIKLIESLRSNQPGSKRDSESK